MPWAFKLCLATVTGPSLVYMTVAYVYTVNRSCLERLPGWVFWQLLTALETSPLLIHRDIMHHPLLLENHQYDDIASGFPRSCHATVQWLVIITIRLIIICGFL